MDQKTKESVMTYLEKSYNIIQRQTETNQILMNKNRELLVKIKVLRDENKELKMQLKKLSTENDFEIL